MDQPTLIATKSFVRDLADGQEVDSVFVVRAPNQRQKRNGDPFLKLQLGDATGPVEAVAWDWVDELAPGLPAGAIVRVRGRFSVDERYGAGITIRRMRAAAEGEYDLADLAEAPPIPYARWQPPSVADRDRPAPAPARSCSTVCSTTRREP